jgi:hypothetical protein
MYDAKAQALPLVQGPVPVAPCQTLLDRFKASTRGAGDIIPATLLAPRRYTTCAVRHPCTRLLPGPGSLKPTDTGAGRTEGVTAAAALCCDRPVAAAVPLLLLRPRGAAFAAAIASCRRPSPSVGV